jgi:hypothetical protein
MINSPRNTSIHYNQMLDFLRNSADNSGLFRKPGVSAPGGGAQIQEGD